MQSLSNPYAIPNEMVNIMAKAKLFTIETIKDQLVVTYADGVKDTLDVKALDDKIKELGMYHGFKQKLGDSAANAKGDLNYAKASIGGVIEALTQKEWNRRGGGTGGTLLIEAIARIKEIDESEARSKLAALTDQQVDQLKKADSVKAMILTIKTERAQPSDDGDEALDLI